MVRGYRDLLKNHGSKSFEELVQPALGFAECGHPLGRGEAYHLGPQWDCSKKLKATEAVFLPQGLPIRARRALHPGGFGEEFRRLIEAGLDDFYEGELARQIASAIQECGGVLSVDDLADHESTITEPISVEYRGYRINQTGLPSQGMIHLEAMRIADHALGEEPFWSERAIHRQIEAVKLAFADRLGYAQDPKTGDTPLEVLLSDDWARKRAGEIGECATTSVSPGSFQDGDTTYLCVVDGNGMMVSLIQSVSNAFGSGVVAGDTGIVMNNRVGRGFTLDASYPNVYAPGKRTMHTLNCFSIERLDGTPVLVGGTPGGDGQPQWNLAMVSGLIDGKLDVQQATEMPRWTSGPAPIRPASATRLSCGLRRRSVPSCTRRWPGVGTRSNRLRGGTARPRSLRAIRRPASWSAAVIPASKVRQSDSREGSVAFAERLAAQIERANSLVCVGLDPDPARFPQRFREMGRREAIVEFNRAIIEATADLVCAYKPNLALLRRPGARWHRRIARDSRPDPSRHPGHPRLQGRRHGQHGDGLRLGLLRRVEIRGGYGQSVPG